jgi:transposase-like protein
MGTGGNDDDWGWGYDDTQKYMHSPEKDSTSFRYVFQRSRALQRVGIRARETNNIVERLHGTLKDRTKPMRGLKSFESTKLLLEGYAVHYNCVRPH